MNTVKKMSKQADQAWNRFVKKERLSPRQAERFSCYMELLCEWNTKINLTRITNVPDILAYHFQDSLRLASFIDLATVKGVCDVGTGGGFPGIPLKIMYPELFVVLLEVNEKKQVFLNTLIEQLDLADCITCPLDWRTFLRSAPYEIDLFCARASLKPDELIRMFKPGCAYKAAQLIYWASRNWKPTAREAVFFTKKERYPINGEKRFYAFFDANGHQ